MQVGLLQLPIALSRLATSAWYESWVRTERPDSSKLFDSPRCHAGTSIPVGLSR